MKLYAEGDWAKRGPYVEVPDSLPVISNDPAERQRQADELVRSGAMTREAADRMLREWDWTDEERAAEGQRRGEP